MTGVQTCALPIFFRWPDDTKFLSRTNSGRGSSRSFRNANARPKAGALRPMIEHVWKVFYGYCGAVHVGVTCRIDIHHRARVGGGWRSGKVKTCCGESGTLSSTRWTSKACSTGTKCSLTPAFRRQKKGRPSRQNQAGKRYKVVGGGGWSGNSTRMPDRKCFAC